MMSTKICSSTPVVVTWLEPVRDRGRQSIIKAEQIVKPHRSKLRPGITVLIKWKSSRCIYKATVKSVAGVDSLDVLSDTTGQPEEIPNRPSVTTNVFELNDGRPLKVEPDESGDDDEDVMNRPSVPAGQSTGASSEEEKRTDPMPDAAIPPSLPSPQVRLHDDLSDDDDDNPPLVITGRKRPRKSQDLVTPEITSLLINTDAAVLAREIKNVAILQLQADVKTIKREQAELRVEFAERLETQSDNFGDQMLKLLEVMNDIRRQNATILNTMNQRINRKNAARLNPATPTAPTAPGAPTGPSHASRNIAPVYGILDGDNVKIATDDGNDIFVGKESYDRYLFNSHSPTSFLRKLMPHFFSIEDMVRSNFEGGDVVTATGRTHMLQLDPVKSRALLRQVELEYNGSTRTVQMYSKLKCAINDRCRSERRK